MKYTVSKSVVRIVGKIWMPMVEASQQLTLSDYDVENCKDDEGKITRESVESWLMTHSGDFSSVKDFWASLEIGNETIEIPWADEESELAYSDLTYPVED